MIDLDDMQKQAQDRIPLPIFRKLAWHIRPRNMPFIRRLWPDWRSRDAEYQASGQVNREGGA